MNIASDGSYTKTLHVEAAAKDLFHVLTNPEDIAAWWNAASATGSGATGGEFHIAFGSEEQPTILRVLAAHEPNVVFWDVAVSPLVPEWVGTRATFTLATTADGCRLDFAHHALVPSLDCYRRCAMDWGHFLNRAATPKHAELCTPWSGDTGAQC
jgi:uncharacterized protein YndB with AHSA1/START domain